MEPRLAYSDGRVIEIPKKKQTAQYSCNLSHLLAGRPGLYKMEAPIKVPELRLKGRVVFRQERGQNKASLNFLPYEFKKLDTGEILYTRGKDLEHIYIPYEYLKGKRLLFDPKLEKRFSENAMVNIEEIQRFMGATIFLYSSDLLCNA